MRPLWAAGSAGNMRKLSPLPDVQELVLLVDKDEEKIGEIASADCLRSWVAAGRPSPRRLLSAAARISMILFWPSCEARHERQQASALWTYCEASTRYIFGDLTGDRVADTILRALRHAGTDGMSRSDIHNHFGRNITADKISAAFGMLLAAGKVRSDKQKSNNGGPGRVREMWFIV